MGDASRKALFDRIRATNAERDRREAIDAIGDVQSDLNWIAEDDKAERPTRADSRRWAAALAEALRALGDE
jgi:hypothetical protein